MAVRKKTEQGAEPLMAKHEAAASATRTRRNKAADIVRTDRFRNIENGMIPFKYSRGVGNNSNIEVRDTIILCQKAYYNFCLLCTSDAADDILCVAIGVHSIIEKKSKLLTRKHRVIQTAI